MRIFRKFKKSIAGVGTILLELLLFCLFIKTIHLTGVNDTFINYGLKVNVFIYFLLILFFKTIFGRYNFYQKGLRDSVISESLVILFSNLFYLELTTFLGSDLLGMISFDLQTRFISLSLQAFLIQFVVILSVTFLFVKINQKLNKRPSTVVIYQESYDSNRYINTLKKYDDRFDFARIMNVSEYNETTLEGQDFAILLNLGIEDRNKIMIETYRQSIKTFYTVDLLEATHLPFIETAIEDVPLMVLENQGLSTEQNIVKRIIDIIISLLAILITLPIWLVVALAIKIEDGGSVFFTQTRIKKDNQPYKIIKFRSMYENNGKARLAQKNDDRITKTGHVIRRFRVDELPQFLNVLKGDMSVVGPRPEVDFITENIAKELPEFRYRTKVKPGITGLAQIYGKYNTPPSDKLKFDLFYIENYSILFDIKLIFQTLTVFFKKESVEADEKTES